MKGIPLVSIITPSLNQGQFIEDTILSIKNQDYVNIEHIIVDGASTDNTLEILKKYEGTYNMRWISEPDEGQADAIVKGLKVANGAILTWLNSDDYYLHDKVLSKVVDYFELFKNIHVITGDGYYVDEKRAFLSPVAVKKEFINLRRMRYADYMLQPSTFFTMEVLSKISIDKQFVFAFDWLFFLKMFEERFNILVTDDFLSAYRIHRGHKTGEDSAKRKKEIARVAKRNFGAYSLQTLYCYSIYWLYTLSEFLPKSIGYRLKAVLQVVNLIMSKLTFHRIYSC